MGIPMKIDGNSDENIANLLHFLENPEEMDLFSSTSSEPNLRGNSQYFIGFEISYA
jgi:hypothetical protein